MGRKIAAAAIMLFAFAQTGYSAGIDAKLSTENERIYRQSLEAAWKDMSEAQQKAYNWAVGSASLRTLASKYPDMTPRKVIEREADEYIARRTRDMTELMAELAANAEKLAREEEAFAEVRADLAKLEVTTSGFQKVMNQDRSNEEFRFNFTVQNGSRFNVAALKWDAWLYLNGEAQNKEKFGRYCQISLDYKKDGGLLAGKTKEDFITLIGAAEQCSRWKSLEVQHAALRVVKMELDEGSVEDFGNRSVLPYISRTRDDYERGIDRAREDLKFARGLKAALNP